MTLFTRWYCNIPKHESFLWMLGFKFLPVQEFRLREGLKSAFVMNSVPKKRSTHIRNLRAWDFPTPNPHKKKTTPKWWLETVFFWAHIFRHTWYTFFWKEPKKLAKLVRTKHPPPRDLVTNFSIEISFDRMVFQASWMRTLLFWGPGFDWTNSVQKKVSTQYLWYPWVYWNTHFFNTTQVIYMYIYIQWLENSERN